MPDEVERIGWRLVAVLFAAAIVLKLTALAWKVLHG